MTRKEAINVLKCMKHALKERDFRSEHEALNMAIESLSADRPTGEWIFNPKDAIELMFTLPKCSKCGCESADCGNFCSNCGAIMKGGAE